MIVTATEIIVIVEIIISLSIRRVSLLVLKEDWIIEGHIYGYHNWV
jgi:hypothetical protein